ncbi:MAG: DUF3467 domain-containing protein [Phycisphaerales bacterium JB059]
MSENPQQQQVQVRFDESKMTSTYANTIRSMSTGDEVVLDFGMNLPMQGPNNEPMMVISIGSRVIMNWVAAKRLAMQVGNAVRQYEERNGEISLGQPQGPAGA